MRRRMTDHLAAERRAILDKALDHVPFDGWTERSLRQGAADAGFDDIMVQRAFPRGGAEAIEFWSLDTDREMAAALAEQAAQKDKRIESLSAEKGALQDKLDKQDVLEMQAQGLRAQNAALAQTLADCEAFLRGDHDATPEDQCYMRGAMS